jgi:hypothetical protein
VPWLSACSCATKAASADAGVAAAPSETVPSFATLPLFSFATGLVGTTAASLPGDAAARTVRASVRSSSAACSIKMAAKRP